MVDQNKSTSTIIAGLFGLAVGGLLVYWLLKNTNQQLKSSNSNTEHSQYQLNDIQKLEQRIDQRIGNIENMLQSFQLKPTNINTNIPVQQNQQIVTQQDIQPMQQIQENEEECIIKTNDKGRIIGFTTHRKLFGK